MQLPAGHQDRQPGPPRQQRAGELALERQRAGAEDRRAAAAAQDIAAQDDDGLWRLVRGRYERQVLLERDQQRAAHLRQCEDQETEGAGPGQDLPDATIAKPDQQAEDDQEQQRCRRHHKCDRHFLEEHAA